MVATAIDAGFPPLSDNRIMPSIEAINAALDLNCAHQSRIKDLRTALPRIYPHKRAEIEAACEVMIDEANDAWWAWYKAKPGFPPLRRRFELAQLRELIGPEAYYAGRLPPPVPLEHLRRR